MTKTPVITPATPQNVLPDWNAHAAQPNDSEVRSVTKMRWKAYRDMFQWVAVPGGKSAVAPIVSTNKPMAKKTVNASTV